MAYSRCAQPDSDVYMIGTPYALECFGAGWEQERDNPVHDKIEVDEYELTDEGPVKTGGKTQIAKSWVTNSRTSMIDHLHLHAQSKHKVPHRAIQRLKDEIDAYGDTYPNSSE